MTAPRHHSRWGSEPGEGTGEAVIEGETVALKPRDIVVVPSWKSVAFKAASRLVLFGYSDKACQEKLNLYKEENA